jgi:hypothetical protein
MQVLIRKYQGRRIKIVLGLLGLNARNKIIKDVIFNHKAHKDFTEVAKFFSL